MTPEVEPVCRTKGYLSGYGVHHWKVHPPQSFAGKFEVGRPQGHGLISTLPDVTHPTQLVVFKNGKQKHFYPYVATEYNDTEMAETSFWRDRRRWRSAVRAWDPLFFPYTMMILFHGGQHSLPCRSGTTCARAGPTCFHLV